MTKQELLERIEALERRVLDLEARPPQIVTLPTTVPYIQPRPPWRVPTVWRGNVSRAE